MSMQGTKQNAGGLVGFVDDLNGAIRENPVAAGLVGMGVLWMFFGSSKLAALGKTLPGAARAVTQAAGVAAGATGSMVGDALTGTASRVSEAVREVGGTVSSGVEGAAVVVRDAASAGYDVVKAKGEAAAEALSRTATEGQRSSTDIGRQIGDTLQQNLTATLERQPVLLGLVGFAIGAGIASAFPSTRMEQDMMGEAGAAVKDKIQKIATDATEFASQRASDIFDDVKKEAASQGLTPAAASESLKGVVEKVKTAAGASRDAIKGRLS